MALLLPNVGMGLYDPWETHYAETARQMGVFDDWITLHWHADSRLGRQANPRCPTEPELCFFFSKPPLIFWLIGTSFRIFGVSDATARLPMVLVGIAGIFGVFWYLRRMLGLKAGLMSAAVLATTPYYYLLSRQIMTDIAFVVPMSVGLIGLAYYLTYPGEAKQRHLYLFYALAGLSALAKGLLGFLLPGAIVLAFLILRPADFVKQLKRLQIARGVLIFFSVAGPWYGAVYAINGNTWLMEFIVKHHFRRVGAGVHGERGTFEYFIEQLGYGLWPWVALVPLALGAAWVSSRRRFQGADGFRTFLVVWAAVGFGLFTISTTKFHHYVFPAVPAISILVAMTLVRFLDAGRVRPLEKALLFIGLAVLAAVTPIILTEPFRFINLFIYRYNRVYPEVPHTEQILGVAVALFALGVVLLLMRRGLALAVAPILLCSGGIVAAGWTAQGYMSGQVNTLSQRDAFDAYERLRRPDDRIYEWALRWRGEIWYSRDETHEIPREATAQLRRELSKPGRAFIATGAVGSLNSQLQRLFGRPAKIVNEHHDRYAMTLWEGPPEGHADQFVLKQVPSRATKVNARIGDDVELLAYEIRPKRVAQERAIRLTLYFKTSQRLREDWTIFVHGDLPSKDRRQRMISDHPPADGLLPTTRWLPDQIIKDESEILPRGDQQPGSYTFYVGLFRGSGRMPIKSGPNDGEDRVKLGTVEVTP